MIDGSCLSNYSSECGNIKSSGECTPHTYTELPTQQ